MTDQALKQLDIDTARTRIEAGDLIVIDTRAPFDHAGGKIPGSVSLPGKAIEAHWRKVRPGRTVLVVDDDGGRAGAICDLALSLGLADVAMLDGGFEAWFDAGYPVETISDGMPTLDDVQGPP